jgi:nucleoside-diphosphate-sugar epimerase
MTDVENPWMKPGRMVVTGGTGFVGSHLVRRLLHRGHEVTVLDPSPGLTSNELRNRGAVILAGSVSDIEAVDAAVAGADLVFHLASPFGDVGAPDSVYHDTEVVGTRRVLEAAERHAVRRVVHCSTQGVHGIVRDVPGDEDSPVAPRDFYCQSKAEGEKVVTEFLERGLDVVVVRPTSVYGPGDVRGWLKLFRMVNKGRFVMIGDGRTMNHPVYVDNLVDLLELAATVPRARGRTYLGGDAEAVTLERLVREVAHAQRVSVRIFRFPSYRLAWAVTAVVEQVCRWLRIKPPIFRRRLSWFRTNRAFRIDRAVNELGYRPAVDLREGLRRTALWYQEQGLLELPGGERMASGIAASGAEHASLE